MFVRDLEAENRLESFLITAVLSILAIRLYLHITNYPQIGGAGLHIAHMLWGGLFMLVALIMVMATLNRKSEDIAAIIGGIGFGTFIDELGKFITKDNNYFFAPTVSILYVIFVLLYLFIRLIAKSYSSSSKTQRANALDLLKEGIINHITTDEKEKIENYILEHKQDKSFVKGVQLLLSDIHVVHGRKHIFDIVYDHVQLFYRNAVPKRMFRRIIIGIFLIQAVITCIQSFLFTEALVSFATTGSFGRRADFSFGEFGDVIFSTLSACFIIVGIVYILRKSMLRGYKQFKVAMLISIFLTQFFFFYDIQFNALWGFVFNIFILYALRGMIEWEETQTVPLPVSK